MVSWEQTDKRKWSAEVLRDAGKNWRDAEEPAAPTGRIEIGEGEDWQTWSIYALDAEGNKRVLIGRVDGRETAYRRACWLRSAQGGTTSYRIETEPQVRPTPPASAHGPVVPRSVGEWLANKPAGSMGKDQG